MSEVPTHIKAAVVLGPDSERLVGVESVPFPKASQKQMIIKLVAFAVNPTDWKHIEYGLSNAGAISGSDVSGIVEDVGGDVTGFKVGDYVSSFMRGAISKDRGAFAEYAVIDPQTTIKYDKSSFEVGKLTVGENDSQLIRSFEGAASVTLGLVTVALSFSHSLKIDYDVAANAKRTILIWGGATATGLLAIQIAKIVYGLKVFTTASKDHHEFLKSLGADETFDYKDADVVDQIKSKANGLIRYGLDTVSDAKTFQALYDATEGSNETVHLDNLLLLGGKDIKEKSGRKVHYGGTLAYVAEGHDASFGPAVVKATPELLKDYSHFWEQVLPHYIQQIRTTHLHVLPEGLESAEEALELSKSGKARASKIVWRA